MRVWLLCKVARLFGKRRIFYRGRVRWVPKMVAAKQYLGHIKMAVMAQHISSDLAKIKSTSAHSPIDRAKKTNAIIIRMGNGDGQIARIARETDEAMRDALWPEIT